MRWCHTIWALVGFGLAGCTSSSTHLLEAPSPKYDADAVAQAALTEFDKNSSGTLEPGELSACPALLQGFAAIDTNRDKRLSADELKQRVEAYAALASGSVPVGCIVTLDGKPLADAIVTFVPEACMGGVLKPATARTNVAGHCDEFTIDGKTYRGPGAGLYKIQVTKDGVAIPARFNAQTMLGREVYPDPRSGEVIIVLRLTSR
jgi:hypothetical protein